MVLDLNKPFPKRPRLRDFEYKGTHAYFITILTKNHGVCFKDAKVVSGLVEILNKTALSERFKVLTYCFMPDHLHLLVAGEDDESDLKKFVSFFKQKSGYWFRKNYNENLWHLSYYDHVLRKEESIEGVANYILGNPARKGLISDPREYAFSWSFYQG
jgi:putative transposase